MRHLQLEITYDNFSELEGALNYIKTKLRKNVKNMHCSDETTAPFKLSFSNSNFFNMLEGKCDYAKEPDRIETNENGDKVFIYKSKF